MGLGLGHGFAMTRPAAGGGGAAGPGDALAGLLAFVNAQADGAVWDMAATAKIFTTAAGSTPSALGDRIGRIEDRSAHGNHLTQPEDGGDARPKVGDYLGLAKVSNGHGSTTLTAWLEWDFDNVPGTFGFVSPFGAQIGYLPYGTVDCPVVEGMLMFFIPGDEPLSGPDTELCMAALTERFAGPYRDGVVLAGWGLTVDFALNTAPYTGQATPDDFNSAMTLDFDVHGDVDLPDDLTGDYTGSPYFYGYVADASPGDYFSLVVSTPTAARFIPSRGGSHGQVFDLTTTTELEACDDRRACHEGILPQTHPGYARAIKFYSSEVGNGKKGLVGSLPVNFGNVNAVLYSVYGQRITGPIPDISGCGLLESLQLQHNVNLTGYESPSLPSSLKYLGCYATALTVSDRETILAHLRAAAVTSCYVEIDFDGLGSQAMDDIDWLENNGGNTVVDR